MTSNELALQKKLQKIFEHKEGNASEVLRNLTVLGVEVPLHSPNSILTSGYDLNLYERNNANIGRIDALFRYKRKKYVVEIKDYAPKHRSFWYATKAIAYCEYFKWQSDDNSYCPAIIIPAESLRLEHQIVAGRLGLSIFLFKKIKGEFQLKLIDDKPHWKQDLWK